MCLTFGCESGLSAGPLSLHRALLSSRELLALGLAPGSSESNYAELIIKGLSYTGEIMFYLGNVKSAKDIYVEALYIAKNINAKNAILQIKIVLNSFGLNEEQIEKELSKLDNT